MPTENQIGVVADNEQKLGDMQHAYDEKKKDMSLLREQDCLRGLQGRTAAASVHKRKGEDYPSSYFRQLCPPSAETYQSHQASPGLGYHGVRK